MDINKNPWLGLASYDYKDADRFYGRKKDTEDLFVSIRDNYSTIVYGVSGVGKSSLINAGIMPRLNREPANRKYEKFLPVRIRLSHDPKQASLCDQIINKCIKEIEAIGGDVDNWSGYNQLSPGERLWLFFHTTHLWSKDNYLQIPVILLDQFEELFTLNEKTPDRIVSFFQDIEQLFNPVPPSRLIDNPENSKYLIGYHEHASGRIVFSMREDFLARLEDYTGDLPLFRQNRKGIRKLNGLQALEIITQPVPGLVDKQTAIRIIKNVTGDKHIPAEEAEILSSFNEARLEFVTVDASILSLYCSELYKRVAAQSKERIGFEDVRNDVVSESEEHGVVSDILMQFYQDNVEVLGKKTYEYLESKLLTAKGFRNQAALEDIDSSILTSDVISSLEQARIIRKEIISGTPRIEFTHDILCKVADQHRKDVVNREKNTIELNKALENQKKETRGQIFSSILFTVDCLFIAYICNLCTNGITLWASLITIILSLFAFTLRVSELAKKREHKHFGLGSLISSFIVCLVAVLLAIHIEPKALFQYFLPVSSLSLLYIIHVPLRQERQNDDTYISLKKTIREAFKFNVFYESWYNRIISIACAVFFFCLSWTFNNWLLAIFSFLFWITPTYLSLQEVRIKKHKKHYKWLIVVVVFIFEIISGYWFSELYKRKQHLSNLSLLPVRGIILDINGRSLAATKVTRVYNTHSVEKLNDDDYCSFSSSVTFPSFMEIPTRINSNCVEKNVNGDDSNTQWPLHIGVETNYSTNIERYYPYGDLARSTIGVCDDQRKIGIENSFDNYLYGEDGHISKGGIITPAKNGYNIRTTLNVDYQRIADKSLRRQIDQDSGIRGGIALILEVETGAVRAMVNLVRDTIPGSPLCERDNLVLRQRGEQGSVMKTVTLTSLVEDGLVTLDQRIGTLGGRIPGVPSIPYDDHVARMKDISIIHGLEISSNYVFARLAQLYYSDNPQRYYDHLFAYGLGTAFDFDIDGLAKPEVHTPGSRLYTESTLLTNAYGYGISITPLHLAMFYNAIANKGRMMKPYLVESIEQEDRVVRGYGPVFINNICSKATADTVTRALRSVVTHGTGMTHLSGAKLNIAGKTGTARTVLMRDENPLPNDPYTDKFGRHKFQGTFVGFFPAEKPKYTMLITVYSYPSRSNYYGSDKPARAYREIVDQIYSIDNKLSRISESQ